MRGTLKVVAVKAPDFGERRKLILEDIAILTGGTVFDKDKGMKLDKFNWEWFGEAKTVTVTKEKTTIIDGNGTAEAITARAEELQAQIEKAQTPFEVEKLQERLSKFVGGVALVHVGGSTETEMKEKKDRVDDALHATQCALEDGIVPGGGSALLYAREGITQTKKDGDDFNYGKRLVYKACGKPFEVILANAGYVESDMELGGDTVPTTSGIEDYCYSVLEDFGGWENNDGSQGSIRFNLKSKEYSIDHQWNTEEPRSFSILEIKI